MRMILVPLRLLILQVFVIITIGMTTRVYGQNCSSVLPPLPDDVVTAKNEIIALAKNNIQRWGDRTIQELINKQATILENWFINNRPDNEIELTTGPWYAAWYEDTSFFPSNIFLDVDRTNTYQIVRNGFYYNVAKFDIGAIWKRSWTNYLKGEFTIKDPKMISSCGKKRRNIVDLKFTNIAFQKGFVPKNVKLTDYIDSYNNGEIRRGLLRFRTKSFTTGDLWNLFVDNDVRVCYGVDDGQPLNSGGMFILLRQESVNG